MTNHPTNEELFAYRDGELGHEKRGLVEAHVLSCTACQARIDEVSDSEGILRQQHAEPDEAYFDSLTRSVMARVAPGAQVAARAEAPRARPGRRRSLEDEPRGRAPRLPWPAIASAVSAAAAVAVVVVLLIQRQDAWRHAPAPGIVGLGKDAAEKKKQEAPPLETQPLVGEENAPAEEGSTPAPETLAKLEAAPKNDEDTKPAAPSQERSRDEASATTQAESEIRSQNAADAMPEVAQRKDAAAPSEPQGAVGLNKRAAAQAPAPAAGAAAGATAGESEFAPLAARYGLPLLYDPSRVSSDVLLRAEPELRVLYMMGRAGEDSARVRLYLAEAARIRAGDSPDTETYDTIVHHYQRAAQLARDPETARMARKRLEEFVSRHAPPR